ncbi:MULTISPECIES: hypothetical protein [unclassified Pseudomonas]|jgi:hypothetical protein|uniref:hypothetical protein n=1 Tax=unclassified Pseudomonas TaxID=196821 RepID=UPI000D3ACB46|nr:MULTISPECIES: hypothetical protein [unclassified Pseudomonas]PTR14328.1 hypothetical protein C8K63_1362 [Pseudomonas sp. GV085]
MELSMFSSSTVEYLRLGVVYFHLIACCVAIGLVLTSDIAMVQQLLKGDVSGHHDDAHMDSLQKTVSLALVVLWITGVAIVGIDYAGKGMEYFLNPKIQAKIGIVVLLTINGFVLHRAVLPALKKAGSLLKLSFSLRMLALFSGAFSGVSWFYAALLGVGRPLAWKYSLLELLAAYPVLIVGGFGMMLLLTAWAKDKDTQARLEQGTGTPGNAALAGW